MHRIEVRLKPHIPDARGLGLVKDIADLGIKAVTSASVTDVYYLDARLPRVQLENICRELLADPVTQDWWSHCKPCQEPVDSAGPDEWWANMEEVFHLD